MKTALLEAVALLLSGDRQLGIILATTLRMVLASSLLALVLLIIALWLQFRNPSGGSSGSGWPQLR